MWNSKVICTGSIRVYIFKQQAAYEIRVRLMDSELCISDRY